MTKLRNGKPAIKGWRTRLARIQRQAQANHNLGAWLSAALDDPNTCAEMKSAITEWFEAHDDTRSHL